MIGAKGYDSAFQLEPPPFCCDYEQLCAEIYNIIRRGIVYETLDMSQLPEYAVGGTLHVVVNNQVRRRKLTAYV